MEKRKRKNEALQISGDDRLWAALCWLQVLGFWPWCSILVLLAPQTKDRPFIRYNAILSTVTLLALIPITVITLGFGALAYFGFFYWANRAYKGEWVELPYLTDFIDRRWF